MSRVSNLNTYRRHAEEALSWIDKATPWIWIAGLIGIIALGTMLADWVVTL